MAADTVPSPLRALLLAELRAAATSAGEAARLAEQADAVHGVRKALRRARAILALVGDALPRGDRRAVRRGFRDARRELGRARDHAVAPEALGQLGLDAAARDTVRAVIEAASAAEPHHGEVAQALAAVGGHALAQVEIVERALPPELEWSTVLAGVRRVYRDARRAHGDAKRRSSFHRWRRRTKELVYQLELLARHAPALDQLAHELSAVADQQGPAVDLIMLREFVQAHGAELPDDARDHLLDQIAEHARPLIKTARRAGRDTFRRRAAEVIPDLA